MNKIFLQSLGRVGLLMSGKIFCLKDFCKQSADPYVRSLELRRAVQ